MLLFLSIHASVFSIAFTVLRSELHKFTREFGESSPMDIYLFLNIFRGKILCMLSLSHKLARRAEDLMSKYRQLI